ncbi:methyltransferase [Fusobacterium sp.]|uniref:tRNA1(Val) (adenine(37)-N6)-methyltransferase n=1 Tax=Fusobacterium sp. TaxID=68766 RepID=UPI0025C540AF|nr:methyltransferase [Fusobacterium sp.]
MLCKDENMTLLKDNYRIIQKINGFRFSVDAVILSDFFLPSKSGKILDIGTGNGVIPILLYAKDKGKDITGIDIQEENVLLAKKNVTLNSLDEYIKIIGCDIKDYSMGNSFDYIVSNPPYMKVDGKKQNDLTSKAIARHEIKLNLLELVKSAKKLLKPRGSFTFVHQSYRFTEIAKVLEECGFSLKRVRFVYFSKEKNSNLVLIEAWKGKKAQLEIMPPLFLEESGY